VPEDTGSTRDDLTAAVGARRELGPDYEDAVLDGFLARLDRQMQERVDATVADRLSSGERRAAGGPAQRDPGLTLGIVSVIAGIPVTAITTGTEEQAELVALRVLEHHREVIEPFLLEHAKAGGPPLTSRSRWTRFLTTLASGTTWNQILGPTPSGSTIASPLSTSSSSGSPMCAQ
jgi:hypothetical protein